MAYSRTFIDLSGLTLESKIGLTIKRLLHFPHPLGTAAPIQVLNYLFWMFTVWKALKYLKKIMKQENWGRYSLVIFPPSYYFPLYHSAQ